MSNYKIGNITLDSLISTVTRNTQDVNLSEYKNLSLKVPINNRGYKIDCISPTDKYTIIINGEKKSIFDEYEVITKTIYNRSAESIYVDNWLTIQSTPDVTINLRTESINGHFTHFRAVLYGGSGGGSSEWRDGGGGGGGAYVLSEKISTANIDDIILRPGDLKKKENAEDAQIIIYYDNNTQAVLKAPGGGNTDSTTGGSGGIFDASLHNTSNFPLVQTINGSNGEDGGYEGNISNYPEPQGGTHGSNSSDKLYKDIVVPYSQDDAKDGFYKVFFIRIEERWTSTHGLAVVYLYNDES
jgi:hypothetical protein